MLLSLLCYQAQGEWCLKCVKGAFPDVIVTSMLLLLRIESQCEGEDIVNSCTNFIQKKCKEVIGLV